MKKKNKIFALVLAVVFAATLAFGCGKNNGTSGGGDKTSESEEESVNNTIDKGDSKNPSYGFDADGELQASSATKQSTVNKLQTTDDYGRSVDYIDGYKTDKRRYVGLFYFTWLGWHGSQMDGVYDVSENIISGASLFTVIITAKIRGSSANRSSCSPLLGSISLRSTVRTASIISTS